MSVAPLSSIAGVIRGVSFSKEEGDSVPSADRLPVIRAGSIQGTLLVNQGQIWVPKGKVKKHQMIRKDDIVMCTSSGSSDLVGKCAKAEVDFDGSFGAFCAGIRPDCKKVSPSYLYHFLSSPNFRNWTKSSSGANIKNIRISELAEFEIPLPPLPEQKRIAAILDKADAIRRKRQQAIQLADEFLRAVFLDMFGDPVTNPKGWDVVELSELVEPTDKLNYGVVQPGEDDLEGVPLVRSGDLSDDTPKPDKLRKVSKSIDHKHRKSRLKGNEILIACVGSIGRVGWVTKNMVGWNIARAVTRIPVRQGVNREYLYRYLQNPVVQGYFERETRAVAQPTLNVSLIAKTPIALPPVGLQTEFLMKYEAATALKKRYLNALDSQAHIFSALSQKAFSGTL